MDPREAARRALACLDLTNLDDGCDPAAISALCARARTARGPVAAVCVWPRFVAQCRARARRLRHPHRHGGELPLRRGAAQIPPRRRPQGARRGRRRDRPRRPLAPPRRRPRADAVTDPCARSARSAAPPPSRPSSRPASSSDPALIRQAADAALAGGPDFLKTSTGKVPVNATPEAAEILLRAILASGRDVGLKPAGGVRTTADAATYLALCDRLMGEGWATPARFRIGASGVLAALLATLDGAEAPTAGKGY